MSDMDNMRCAHGVLVFDNPPPACPHCELVWQKEVATNAQRRLAAATAKIVTLTATLSKRETEG